MKLEMLKSSPLRPIATRLRDLTKRCGEVCAATAFISRDAADALIASAKMAGARVRILTGTFGYSTRKTTFSRLLSSKKAGVETRVWSCATHGNFHAKLYIWRLPRQRGVVWIGSANLTDGGMQNEGELIAQISGGWASPGIASVRRAFEAEWQSAADLNEAFVRGYREAKRQPPDERVARGTRRQSEHPGSDRVFTCYASTWYADQSPVVRRVDNLLGGTASRWHRANSPQLRRVRRGDRCIYVDLVDHTVGVVEVTDKLQDGACTVFAYEPILNRKNWMKWNRATRSRIAELSGLQTRGKSLGTRWLNAGTAKSVYRGIYGDRADRLVRP